jgi:AcrR family transcriptional regulator
MQSPSLRPDALRSDAIRQDRRILDIAREQIKRFGAKRLTVVSVAEEAGMTHANIYRYFTSKLALCDALTGQWLREVEARQSMVVDSPDPADDKLERLLLDLMRQHRSRIDEEPELYSLLMDAYAKNRTVIRQHRTRIGQLIEQILENGMATQTFQPRGREAALGLVYDLGYRFLHPQAIGQDRMIPAKAMESRHALAARSIILALKATTA